MMFQLTISFDLILKPFYLAFFQFLLFRVLVFGFFLPICSILALKLFLFSHFIGLFFILFLKEGTTTGRKEMSRLEAWEAGTPDYLGIHFYRYLYNLRDPKNSYF